MDDAELPEENGGGEKSTSSDPIIFIACNWLRTVS